MDLTNPISNSYTSQEPSMASGAGPVSKVNETPPESELQAVQMWTKRIRAAKAKFQPDFKRIRDNMNFAAGIQWKGQKTIRTDKYVANLTLKVVNQKVATLYAKNPKAEFLPRKRLNFTLWDGKEETLQMAIQGMVTGGSPQAMAMMADFVHGKQTEEMVKRVGETLVILYEWNFDNADPEILEQMKQLVRRTVTCGVSYVRLGFHREDSCELTDQSGMDNSTVDTAKRLKYLASQVEEGDKASEEVVEDMKQLMNSLMTSIVDPDSQYDVKERLMFDFPRPASIIVDPNCTNLKCFVGAKWIAQEYILDVDDANAYFESQIPSSGSTVLYKDNGSEQKQSNITPLENVKKPKVCVWELINKTTKSRFFICDGYDRYLSPPEELPVNIHGFWPVRALTFNDIEVEPGLEATIYPPSDVELMRSAQKERNRCRDGLKDHRKANAPLYMTLKNWLTPEDMAKITSAMPNEVIVLNSPPPQGMKLEDMVAAKGKIPIDPMAYDTTPLEQDILDTVGAQEANLGRPNPKGTATGQAIAEQSRMSVSTSNIDDLDNLLSWMARGSGEIALRNFSRDTVIHVCGDGSVWPSQPQEVEDILNSVLLAVKASSSGRPNKQMELQNWSTIAPVLMQMGANPMFMVRETLRRLDDNLDPTEAFPLMPTGMMAPAQGGAPQDQAAPGVNAPNPQNRPGPGQLGERQQQPGQQPPQQPMLQH